MATKQMIAAGLFAAALVAPASAQDINLEYWAYSDFAQGEALKLQTSFIEEFKAKHPGVNITISGRNDDSLLTGQIAGAVSKTGPDVFMNSTSQGAVLVDAGALKNIYKDWMAMPQEFRDQFDPSLIAMCTPKPEVMYCLPYTGYASILYRNLTVLEKAGIDTSKPIKSWDDWKAQMKQVADHGLKALPDLSQTWFGLANVYSGVAKPREWGIDFENSKTLISPELLAKATQFMIDVKPWNTGTNEDDQITKDLFISNQLAFIPNGPWIDPIFQQAAENQGLKYDRVVIPAAAPGEKAGVKGYEFIAVGPKKTSDIAWQFAAYVSDKAQTSRWAAALGRYVANSAALKAPEAASNKLISITNEAASGAIFNRPPFFKKAYPTDYWSVLLDGVANIVDGNVSPEEGSVAVVNELNEVIAED